MNKIIVEEEKVVLENTCVFMESKIKNVVLQISGEVCIAISKIETFSRLEIYLEKDSRCLFECFGTVSNHTQEIIIHSKENAVMDLHYACLYQGNSFLTITSSVEEKNVHNYIKVRAVEKMGTMEIKATGAILEPASHCFYGEDIRVLAKEASHVKVMPDLLVSNQDVMATHNATISALAKEELEYLMGKGILLDTAKKLLTRGFLESILEIVELKNKGGDDIV